MRDPATYARDLWVKRRYSGNQVHVFVLGFGSRISSLCQATAAKSDFYLHFLATMPVASRVNAKYFEQAAEGSPLRVAGRMSADPLLDGLLTTTDGGKLNLAGENVAKKEGFVEVIGRKEGKSLMVEEVLFLGDSLDVEMWDGAVEMMHQPAVKELFGEA